MDNLIIGSEDTKIIPINIQLQKRMDFYRDNIQMESA